MIFNATSSPFPRSGVARWTSAVAPLPSLRRSTYGPNVVKGAEVYPRNRGGFASIRGVKTSFAAALLGALTLAGCFYPADRGQVLEDKLEKLTVQNKALEQELKETRDKQQASLDDVQKALEQLDKASRRSDADVGVQMQKTVEDVAALHGTMETIQYRLGVLEDAQKKTNDELAKRAEADAAAEKKKE